MTSNKFVLPGYLKSVGLFVFAFLLVSLLFSLRGSSSVYAAGPNECSDSGTIFSRVDVFVRVVDHENKAVGYARGFKFKVTATTPDPGNYAAGSPSRDLANIQKQRLLGNGSSQSELNGDTFKHQAAINGPAGNPSPGSTTDPGVPSQSQTFEMDNSNLHFCQPAGGDDYWMSANGVTPNSSNKKDRPAYDFTNGQNGNFLLNCLGGGVFFKNPYNNIPNKWLLSASMKFEAVGKPTSYIPLNFGNPSGAAGNWVDITSGGEWLGDTTTEIKPTGDKDINDLDRDIIFKFKLNAPEKPEVTVDDGPDTTVLLGSSIKFNAWAKTTASNNAPDSLTFKLAVRDLNDTNPGTYANIPNSPAGATTGPNTEKFKPNREIDSSRYNYEFTPTAPGTYCRRIKITDPPSSTQAKVTKDEETQCHTVEACTGVKALSKSYVDGVEAGTVQRVKGDTTPITFKHVSYAKECGTSTYEQLYYVYGNPYWYYTAPSGASYGIGSAYKYLSNADTEVTFDVPNSSGYTFSLSPFAAVGTYCQVLTTTAYTTWWNSNSHTSDQACVEVTPPTVIPPKSVTLTPEMSVNTPDVEPGDPAQFTGSVYVSGFPDFYADEWGYTQKAYASSASNMQQNPGYAGTQSGSRQRDAGYYYPCIASGQVPNPYTPDPNDTMWACTQSSTIPTCNSPSSGNSTSCPYTEYQYDCQAVDSGWTTATSYTCTDRYICHTQYDGYYATPPACNWWKCQYGASSQTYGIPGWPTSGAAQPFMDTSNPGSSKCQARCGGTGDLAGQALAGASIPDGSKYDQGDLNCYVRPEFSLTCRYTPTNPAGSVVTQSVTVTSNGQWCARSDLTHTNNNIGTQACYSSSYSIPSSWTGTAPGVAMGGTATSWGWKPNPPTSDTDCANVIGKSYVRVVGGDAASGSSATTSAATTCTLGTGNISAWNDTANGNKGSGASVAVFANGLINGFVSGQFATPVLGGYNARPNTFANTNGSPFGGQWNGAPPCINSEKIEATSTSTVMPSTIAGVDKRKIVNQDVFISSNITYSPNGVNGIPGWQSVEDLPLFQLVVEGGNIYISNTVTQLDGLYVAVKNLSNPGKGNIYTCSTGSGSHVTATWSNCKRQLVVNGSLVAEKVFFARDCSTLKRAQPNEKTVFTGGTDEQFCNTASPGTRAAEVINYTPDIWIRSTLGVPSSNYDAVTTLPPVL